MAIDARHPEYTAMLPKWEMIDDVMSDDEGRLKKYLRYLNPKDTSQENKIRNQQYKDAATWYGITSQTVSANIGTMFRRVPTVNLPPELEYMQENANGKGQSLYQLSQGSARTSLTRGRGGLYVAFPRTEGEVSRADTQNGKYVATINRIPAQNIINWRETTVGSKTMLSLVVIETMEETIGDDGYTVEYKPKIVELMLRYGVYSMREWEKPKKEWIPGEELFPTDAKGNKWDVIPFIFEGAEVNDPSVDNPPILPLATMNLKHFMNSADNEESVFWGVQNQPFIDSDDISASMVEDMKKEGTVYYGNRRLMPFKIGVASSPENTQVSAEMDRKEIKMIGLGARISENNTAAKTASQFNGEREGKTSVLSMIASNVSEAYTQALKWAARYMGADESQCSYEINQDFITLAMDAQLIQVMMTGQSMGQVRTIDYIRFMKRVNLFDEETTDEDYLDAIAPSGGMV
jgi:hypothetical protein